MVDHGPLDLIFKALADPSRRAMVVRLSRGPASVSELGASLDMTKQAVSKHVAVLERAGLLARQPRGRIHHCRLREPALRRALDWIERRRAVWADNLDRLESLLEEERPPS